MFCSISGTVPEEPVISKTSGQLFEKRLIEKYIQETGKCPITGEALTLDDLLPVKTNKAVKPRTSSASSIPGLLNLLHDEYDATMLELHTLRQKYNQRNQEMSHALYQHDAATRVISRLIKDRDEARAALENAKQALASEIAARKTAPPSAEPEEAPAAKKPKKLEISSEIIEELTKLSMDLSKARKKRQISPTLATADEISTYSLLSSHPLHKTTQGGITAIDVSPGDVPAILTAGSDGTLQLFDRDASRILAALEGHTKRVTAARFAGAGVIVSASADTTARLWRATGEGSFDCTVLREHRSEVVGVAVQPSQRYFVTASADASWCFYDTETATCMKRFEGVQEPYTAVQFHPDGIILGTATDEAVIRMFEFRSQKNVADLRSGHQGKVRALCFSENGYTLASCADDGVKLWDLRKIKLFREFAPFEEGPTQSIAFDHSGQFLAVAGADARIYVVRKAQEELIKTFQDLPKKGALSVAFTADARQLLVGATDHNLRIFGAA